MTIGGLGRTDLRFLLPDPVRTVGLIGDAGGWSDAFALVGLEPVAHDHAHLRVALAADVATALSGRPASVLLEGPPAQAAFRAAGLATTEYLPLPTPDLPAVVVPAGAGAASYYMVTRTGGSPDLLRGLRNRVAGAAVGLGRIPAGPARWTLIRGAARPPFPVAAARDLGVSPDATVALVPGASDLLSRGALVLFPPGARVPKWVIKFARVPGVVTPFERDAAGLGLVARADGVVGTHAPRLAGRMEVAGLQMSVETAARGQSLVRVLESRVIRQASKERLVRHIAEWLTDVGAATMRRAPALAPVAARMRAEVLPRWDAPATLADALEPLPSVLAHNDPGTWNILAEGDAFTLLDWESATDCAPPLWDLVYFLAHAALLLDGADLGVDPAAHVIRVFQGDAPSSRLVHDCLTRAARALDLPRAAVGPLVATCWLHHGLSRGARTEAVRNLGGAPSAGTAAVPERLAARWLAAPGLGCDWDAWRP